MRRSTELVLVLALFAAQCASAALWVLPHQFSDDDTGEAVRLARACAELGECTARGTHTSALGLNHGATWIRLLAHFLESGGGLRTVQSIVLVLLMASGAVAFLVVRRIVPPPASFLALLLYLQPAMATADFTKLANSNLLPLPLALYYASAFGCVASGSAIAAAVGSLCLATAMSFNITCTLMVPFHLGLVALSARRRIAAVALAGLSLPLAFSLESYDAAQGMAAWMVGLLLSPKILVAVAVLLLVGPLRRRLLPLGGSLLRSTRELRARLAVLPVRLRWRVAMKAAVAYVSIALWMGSVAMGSPPGHYFAPLVFPLLFLAVDAAAELPRGRFVALTTVALAALVLFPFAPLASPLANGFFLLFSGAAVVAVLAWAIRGRRPFFLGADAAAPAPAVLAFFLAAVTLTASFPDMIVIRRERQSWPVAASETLANGLYETGYTFSQVLAALQRQSPGTVEDMIAILDPDFFGPPAPIVDAGWSLLALMVDPSVAARSEDVVLSFPISRSRSAIVVRAPSYLDRTRLRTCYSVACDREPDPGACTERQPALAPTHLPPFFQVDRQEKPVPGKVSSYQPEGGQYCIRFSMPIRTAGAGVPHLVRATDQWPLQARVTKVSGVDYEGELPGVEVRLTDERESSGVLEVEVSSDGPGPGADWLADPPLIEVTLGNQHLLEPFRSTRTTRW